jgi:hypothetical protein
LQTLQDAVSACWRLDLTYIWIDALCIIQDDSRDWFEQCAQMGEIYSSAYIVIAADIARDCDSGFLGTIKPERLRETQVTSRLGDTWICREKPNRQSDDPNFLLKRTPLALRAWTLQETLLPPRIVHFTGTEVVLRLDGKFACQCNKCSFERLTVQSSHWYQIVSHYSSRDMSDPSDKLSALSGLAARVATTSGTYLAGLWSKSLARNLLWHVVGDSVHTRSKVWRAPTWSWASMDGGVNYFERFHHHVFDSAVEIVDAQCTPLSADHFGQVSSGFILLTGRLVKVSLAIFDQPFSKCQGEYNGEWGKAVRVHKGQTSLVRAKHTTVFEVLCDEKMNITLGLSHEETTCWLYDGKHSSGEGLGTVCTCARDPVDSPIYCLEVGTYMDRARDLDGFTDMGRSSRVWWLVLQRIEESGEEYRRIGVGYKSSRNFIRACNLFDGAEQSTIRLV